MGEQSMTIMLSGSDLTVTQVIAAARDGEAVALAPAALETMRQARAVVQEVLAKGEPVYGLTTGVAERKSFLLDPAERQLWACVAIADAQTLMDTFDIAGALDLEAFKAAGFRAVKIRIDRTDIGTSLQSVRATRAAVGDDIAIMGTEPCWPRSRRRGCGTSNGPWPPPARTRWSW
jgi:histidine ammonia-lyase